MLDSWFRAEYMGAFTDTEKSVFAYEDILAAITSEGSLLFEGSDPETPAALDRDALIWTGK